MITLKNSFTGEPAKHVLSQSGSKSHQAKASQTMDEQTNYDEVMHNKLTKQESWSLYKTLLNKFKSLEDDNRRLLDHDHHGCLHKIRDNQKQKMEMLKNENHTTAIEKKTESNLENVPKNKVKSFRTLPIHETTKDLILGFGNIARINSY